MGDVFFDFFLDIGKSLPIDVEILFLVFSHFRTEKLKTLDKIIVKLQDLITSFQYFLKELGNFLIFPLNRLNKLSNLLQRRFKWIILDLDQWLILNEFNQIYEGIIFRKGLLVIIIQVFLANWAGDLILINQVFSRVLADAVPTFQNDG